MNNRPTYAPVRFVPLARTGQIAADVPADAERRHFFDDLRSITPALIVTGIAIGIASGIGSTVGTTIGTIILERFHGRSRAQKRRR